MKKKSVIRFALIAMLCIAMTSALFVPAIQYARGAPSFTGSATGRSEAITCTSCTVATAAGPAGRTTGDLIIIAVIIMDIATTCGGGGPANRAVSVADNLADTTLTKVWTSPCEPGVGGASQSALLYLFTGLAGGSGAVTYTVTTNGTSGANKAYVYNTALDVASGKNNIFTSGVASGSCNNPCNNGALASALEWGGTPFIFGSILVQATPSPGSGFTLIRNGADAAIQWAIGTVTTGSTFPFTSTIGSGTFTEAGFVFSSQSVTAPFGTFCLSVTSCTSFKFNDSANSVIVVATQSSTSSSATQVTAVTDSLGNTFKEAISGTSCSDFPTCGAGNVIGASIWIASATVIGINDQVTVTTFGSAASLAMEIFNPTGVSATPGCISNSANIASSTVLNTQTACSYTAGSFVVASLGGLGSFALTAGSGFTIQPSGLTNMQAEALTGPGPGTASTFFPATIASATAAVDLGLTLAPSSSSGAQTIGSCPSKNTATVTLANNTEYFYTGTSFSGASINTVSTFVAQVTSAATPQTLSIGIYATANAGSISSSNTFYLIAAFSKSLSAGTTNNAINWSPGIGLSSTIIGAIPTGATIGIAVLGTNKIKINQSSLSGLTTGSTSGGVLAATYTSLSASASQLYLCSQLTYQSILTTTTTTTTTVSTTTTSTTTVNGVGPVPGASVNVNLYMALAIIATLFLVPLKFAGFAGAILGAIVGFGISIAAGLLPTVYIIVLVVGLVAAFFFLRTMNAPGGGGV